MLLKCETPHHKGGASRNSCGGCFRDALSLLPLQTQFQIDAHQVGPELAAIVVTLTIGGGGATSGHPNTPGVTGPGGTSQDAATAIKPRVTYLQHVALRSLERLSEATVYEAAAAAMVSRRTLQPRFSELRAMGLVELTGKRRRNPSGMLATVLRLTEKGRAAL